MENNYKKLFAATVITSVAVGSIGGGLVGFWAGGYASGNLSGLINSAVTGEKDAISQNNGKTVKVKEQSAVVDAVKKVSPAVVSIIITKDLPVIKQYNNSSSADDFFKQFFGEDFGNSTPQYRQNGTEKQTVGGGTGFIITSDGYIVTNNHVVDDSSAEYTVLMNDGSKHPAKILGHDNVKDLAIIKIDGKNLPTVELGNSDGLQAGQTAIAIGNALGEFRNTVSVGVISGLARSITAGDNGGSESLSGVIQTDASINPGNSGGPLLNIDGQVIGINTAIVEGAQNIGFAIPINEVKNDIDSVRRNGRIIKAWLGVRYVLIDKDVADTNKLSVDYGALVVKGDNPTDLAVIPGSPANKAGIEENDIILEVDGQKINGDNPLVNVIGKMKPGDEPEFKLLHQGKEKKVKVKLEELK